jgi:hypothetical protein
MRWVGRVACTGRIKMHADFDVKATYTYSLEDQDVNTKIILKWILINRIGGRKLDLCGSGRRQEADCCQHCTYNEGSTKRGEFLDCQMRHKLLEIFTPCSEK